MQAIEFFAQAWVFCTIFVGAFFIVGLLAFLVGSRPSEPEWPKDKRQLSAMTLHFMEKTMKEQDK